MGTSKNKAIFEVQDNETIDECLARIQKAGYTPVRRTEKPIFKEVIKGDSVIYEPVGRQIVFEARKAE